MKTHKLFFLGAAVAFFVAVADLASKKIIFAILERSASTTLEIKIFDFFSLVQVWNRGVSFGMLNQLESAQIVLSLLQGSIALVLFFWLYRNKKPHVSWALGFVIGGALGNVIDRIKNGAVADFLDFHIAQYHWPAFNLADSFVFIGVMILVFEEFLFKKNDSKNS